MRRTEGYRSWGRINVMHLGWTICPLCQWKAYGLTGVHEVLPRHMTEGLTMCSGSYRTLKAAQELAALRLRAHP